MYAIPRGLTHTESSQLAYRLMEKETLSGHDE